MNTALREKAREILTSKGIKWESLNKDYHWKIGAINFYPTTHRWNVDHTDIKKKGINSLLKFMEPNINGITRLSPDQMFEIAKRVKPMNLNAICETLHKAIYKG